MSENNEEALKYFKQVHNTIGFVYLERLAWLQWMSTMETGYVRGQATVECRQTLRQDDNLY